MGKKQALVTRRPGNERDTPLPWIDESTRGRIVTLQRSSAPGMIFFRVAALEDPRLELHAADSSHRQTVPSVWFTTLRPSSAKTPSDVREAVDVMSDLLIPHLTPCVELLRSQTRAGRFKRALRYAAEIRDVRHVAELLADDPKLLAKARACKTSQEIFKSLPKKLFDPKLTDGIVYLLALLAFRYGVDLSGVEPDDAGVADAEWPRDVRIEEVKSALALHELEQSSELDALYVAPTRDTLVALVYRDARWLINVNRFDGARRSIPVGSVAIDLRRAPGEPYGDHLARISALVPVAATVASRLPVERCPEGIVDRWDRTVGLARANQLPWCASTTLLPLPGDVQRDVPSWRWLVRGNDGSLRIAVLSETTFGLVDAEPWRGPPAPDAGGGILRDDGALDTFFKALPALAAAYWRGGDADSAITVAWTRACKSLVGPPWQPLFHGVAPAFTAWLRQRLPS